MTTTLDDPRRIAAVAGYLETQSQARADLDALCTLAALICDVDSAAVNLIDDAHQHQAAAHGIDPAICAREDSMCAVTVAGDTDIVLADARLDARFAANPWVDGRLAAVRTYASAVLRSPEGHPVGTICVFDDRAKEIPDRARAALRLLSRQVVDVLELRMRTQRLHDVLPELLRSHDHLAAFAGQVSHDLRTPLSATIGFAELLTELPTVQQDDDAREFAARCLSSSRRMRTLVDELLDYARVGGRLQVQPVPLADVVGAVLDDLGELPDAAEVTYEGVDVPADPVQLRALLQNLISNAVAYRLATRRLRIEITARAFDGVVELTVADNGPGILAERRAEALLPLHRLTTNVPGTGLGLATCSRIAAAHGAELTLDETPGGGLTVRLSFPDASEA